jgi:hypothetical protein
VNDSDVGDRHARGYIEERRLGPRSAVAHANQSMLMTPDCVTYLYNLLNLNDNPIQPCIDSRVEVTFFASILEGYNLSTNATWVTKATISG